VRGHDDQIAAVVLRGIDDASYGLSLDAQRAAGDTPPRRLLPDIVEISIRDATSALYCSSAAETALGSTTSEVSGVYTTRALTFAPIAFARAIPCRMAAFDSSEPSVGSKMCLYKMRLVPAFVAKLRQETSRMH
jgi:hypothetical protein